VQCGPWWRQEVFLSEAARQALGPVHPPSRWVMGIAWPKVKLAGYEASPSLQTSIAAKNVWSYTFTAPRRTEADVCSTSSTKGLPDVTVLWIIEHYM